MTVMTIQSQVVHGHVGNSAAVFPLQACGIEVAAVPTALLSNHPLYSSMGGGVLDAKLVPKSRLYPRGGQPVDGINTSAPCPPRPPENKSRRSGHMMCYQNRPSYLASSVRQLWRLAETKKPGPSLLQVASPVWRGSPVRLRLPVLFRRLTGLLSGSPQPAHDHRHVRN
jgi:hypothetical protein